VQGERHAAVRLLKALMVASVVLPLVLFAITAWVDYRNFERLTNERIARSLDILHEHSLRVLETAERVYAEVNEVVRGMSDNGIRLNGDALSKRLKRIVTDTQMQGIEMIDGNGHLLVSSADPPMPKDIDFSKAEHFAALKSGGAAHMRVPSTHPAWACRAISFHCRSAGPGPTVRSTVPSRLQS
jgi:two-component system NtrC family sensor kinase